MDLAIGEWPELTEAIDRFGDGVKEWLFGRRDRLAFLDFLKGDSFDWNFGSPFSLGEKNPVGVVRAHFHQLLAEYLISTFLALVVKRHQEVKELLIGRVDGKPPHNH